GLDQADALGTQDHEAVPPLDRHEAGLTVRVGAISSGFAGLAVDDLELHALAIGLEADGGEGFRTHAEHREDVELVVGGVVGGVVSGIRTLTGPLQHLRHDDDAELIDRTHFTGYGVTTRRILLDADER